MPLQMLCGYYRFRVQTTISESLKKAYERSAEIACEKVAAIRTVASLNHEADVVRDFEQSLEDPVHYALIKVLKSTGVRMNFNAADRKWLSFGQSYTFFALSLLFWYGSTLLLSGDCTITQFLVS